MSPYFCGMAAIPVCPENPGLPRGGRVWWRVLHIMLYLRHPAAVVSYPPLFPASAVFRAPPFLVRRRFLSAAVSRPLPSPVRHAAGQKPPARTCPRSGRQCVALYQPVFWMLFTTIPLVLGALVEMPE